MKGSDFALIVQGLGFSYAEIGEIIGYSKAGVYNFVRNDGIVPEDVLQQLRPHFLRRIQDKRRVFNAVEDILRSYLN